MCIKFLEDEESEADPVSEGTSMTTPHSSGSAVGNSDIDKIDSGSSKMDSSPTSDYFKGMGVAAEPTTSPGSEPGIPRSAALRRGWGEAGEGQDDGSEVSEASDYQLPDDQRFREALNLTKQQSEEFPLGSYRSQPRPPLPDQFNHHLVSMAPPHSRTHFDNLFHPNAPSKGVETALQGPEASRDMISLSFAGITAAGGGGGGGGGGEDPNSEDSFGIAGVSPHAGVPFLPYMASSGQQSESDMSRNEYTDGNWNHSQSGDQFGEAAKTSDRLWSRVVGGKQSAEHQPSSRADTTSLDGMSDSTFHTSHNTSYTMEEDDVIHLCPCDDFVHQSQVENDTFQPYAAMNHSPILLPALLDRGDGSGSGSGGFRGKDTVGSIEGKWTEEDEASVAPDVDYKPRAKSPLPPSRLSRRRELFSNDSKNSNSKISGVSKAPGGGGLAPGSSKAPGGTIAPLGGGSLAVGGGGNPWSHGDEGGVTLGGGISVFSASKSDRTEPLVNGGGVWGAGVPTEVPSTAARGDMLASAFAVSSDLDRAVGGVGGTNFLEALRPLSAGPPSTPKPNHDVISNSHHPPMPGGTVKSGRVGGGEGSHPCLLCYAVFGSASKLGSHCSGDPGHLEMAMLDSGAEMAWRHTPPPPNLPNPSTLQLCNM